MKQCVLEDEGARGIARVYKDWGLLQLACFAIQLQQP